MESTHGELTNQTVLVDEPIITVYGIFKDNTITTQEGEVIECVTYSRISEQIDGKIGFYNLIQYVGHPIWTIFQYILL
jgi:hypothetical protein